EPPAGVFNYILKRPPDHTMARISERYRSESVFSTAVDVGGRAGPGHRLGYRLNAVQGGGTDYVGYSADTRTLLSGALDYHFNDHAVLQTNFIHYRTRITGLPGSIVYDGTGTGSTELPKAIDPTTPGLGQPGAGTNLITTTGLAKFKYDFDNGWKFQVGGLYEVANRHLMGITNKFINNQGDYEVTKNFNAVRRYYIFSNLAQLNGHVQWLGTENDVTLATNGFWMSGHNFNNPIGVSLGNGNLSHPTVLPRQPTPAGGGLHKSFSLQVQSLILGDTMHFNDQWAVQAVLSASFLQTRSYDKSGHVTKSNVVNHEVSPTFNIIYTPTPKWTAYVSWSHSIQAGPAAPTGTANASEFLSPYRDRQVEIGLKYAPWSRLLLTLAAFRMTQPLAEADPGSNVFMVVGTQRNYGAEFFAQGELTPALSIFGGSTYIAARLRGSLIPGTNGRLIVGIPSVKSDISLDYHPAFLRGVALLGTFHFEDRRAATTTNNSFAPAYSTLDLGARYTTPIFGYPVTVRGGVTNVTDTHYYSAIATGNIVGSAGANTAYYGRPRTFLVSVELDL
ncbi:MAG: TonB-dependent receptor, partial [Sinobacteraceae bacterium]|nr:TonB-dependent receptor [Nevskiaceae bacterium]